MARGDHWSENEIALTVADYMRMLSFELAGQPYNKSSHRRELLKMLNGRSNSSVELKHQNISAVLRDLNCIWIPGYKPRGNYQAALATYVEDWINTHPEFDRVSQSAAQKPAFVPSEIEYSQILVDAPKPTIGAREASGVYAPVRTASRRDYVAQEARNTDLGNAGEILALNYEEYRLRAAGKPKLAERIDHVSKTKGDGLGYDILSFEVSGKERFIEVKTTGFAKETPFFASRNEISFSEDFSEQFHLYRLFEFRKSPKFFWLNGAISEHFSMDPVSFICSLR